MSKIAYKNPFSLLLKFKRIVWIFVYYTFYSIFPGKTFNAYRLIILKLFGATIGKNVVIYSNSKIWAPWNMIIGNYSCIGPRVNFYNQGIISIGDNVIISQDSTLSSSTHNTESMNFELVIKSIVIKEMSWIASEAFVGPGSIIEVGTIIGARSVVFGLTESWSVYIGNPAVKIKNRKKIV